MSNDFSESTVCSTDADSTALALYEECLNEMKSRQSMGKIMLYVLTIVGLCSIASAAFGVYYWKKRKIRNLPIESTDTSNSVVDMEITRTVYENHCVSDL